MAATTSSEDRDVKLANAQARQRDANKATEEYEAKRAATLLKTERLRAERLAREAAEAGALQEAPPEPKKSRKAAGTRG